MDQQGNRVAHRVALVTGAARGIGAATVAALAAQGWRVVAVDVCADDPALPYSLGTKDELDTVVATVNATVTSRASIRTATAGAANTRAADTDDGANTAVTHPGVGNMGVRVTPAAQASAGSTAGARSAERLAAARAAMAAGTTAAGTTAAGTGVADPGQEAVIAVVADTRNPAALTGAVAAAERRWGGLDVAIAAAGVIAGGVPAWEVPARQEQTVLDVSLGGVLNLARVAIPAMLRRPEPRHGRFLAVASAAATRGLPMLAAYCAAKAGVAGFIRALATELRGTGITANAVSPGSTATPILDESARLYDLPAAEAFAAQQPLERLLDPREVAAVLAFLASDAASGMTGATVPVDGGLSL
jgi:SDR family mycofactocin-dependent oxidoreductase